MVTKKIGTANTAILGFLLLFALNARAMNFWSGEDENFLTFLFERRARPPQKEPSTPEQIKELWLSLKDKTPEEKSTAFANHLAAGLSWTETRCHILAAAQVGTEISIPLDPKQTSLLQRTLDQHKPDREIINFLFAHGIKPDEKDPHGNIPTMYSATSKKIAELFFKHGLKIDSQEQFFELMKSSLYPSHSSKLIPLFIAQGATAASYKDEKTSTNLFITLVHHAYSYNTEQQKKLLRKVENLFAPLTNEQAYELLTMKQHGHTAEEQLIKQIAQNVGYLTCPEETLLDVLKNKRLELEKKLNKSKSTEIFEDAVFALEAFLP